MAEWKKVQIKSFLKERESRIKPEEANKMGLKRLNKIDFSGEIHLVHKPTNTDMILIKRGDLVISGINVEKGAVAVYQGKEDILATIHYSAYIFDETKIDIEYFKTFLKSKAFRDVINSQIRSGIKTELKASKFLPLEINLPDLETQEKIRNKLNSASGEISELLTIDNKNEEYISKLRQQILQEAIQGKLVKQDSKDEPASALLKKIKSEKDKLVKEGKIRKEKPLNPISDDEIPDDLPNGWEWVRLQEVFDVRDGTHDSPKFVEAGIPLITSRCFENGKINFSLANKISVEDHKEIIKRSLVEKDDILFSMIGGNLGNMVLVDTNKEFSIKNVALFKYYNKNLTPPNYLFLFLKDLANLVQSKSAGGAQPFVALNFFRDHLFPLPPLSEQKRIFEKVDKLMAYCDLLEKEIKENKANSKKLMVAVLKESFENDQRPLSS